MESPSTPTQPQPVPKIPRGSVRNWMSLVPPPDGWDFFPQSTKYFSMAPLPIFATRDHDEEPILPDDAIDFLLHRLEEGIDGVSDQGRLAGKTQP